MSNQSPGPTEKQTTKHCPACGNTYLLLLRTLNKKVCTDCNIEIDWFLEEGQAPLIRAQR